MLARLAAFQSPSLRRSVTQLITTAAPYAASIAFMYYAYYHLSPWLTLALALPAAGLVVRLFIIQHDCGHGAYFRSRWANEAVGLLCSLTDVHALTPLWRRHHAAHHAVWNNLDKRPGGADIYSGCLTLRNTRPCRRCGSGFTAPRCIRWCRSFCCRRSSSSCSTAFRSIRRRRLAEGAVQCLPDQPRHRRVAADADRCCWAGEPVLLVQLPVIAMASIIGVWLFSVQHRFEDSRLGPPERLDRRRRRRCRAVPGCGCRKCCSGSPAISAFTTCIT